MKLQLMTEDLALVPLFGVGARGDPLGRDIPTGKVVVVSSLMSPAEREMLVATCSVVAVRYASPVDSGKVIFAVLLDGITVVDTDTGREANILPSDTRRVFPNMEEARTWVQMVETEALERAAVQFREWKEQRRTEEENRTRKHAQVLKLIASFPPESRDLAKRMSEHDWYWRFSDAHRVWKAGEESMKEIVADGAKLPPEIRNRLWNSFAPENHSTPPEWR